MKRKIVYPAAIPQEVDVLDTNKNVLVAIGHVLQDMLGTGTLFSGLGCVPTGPAGMTVNVNPGRAYSLQSTDTGAYSSLAADARSLVKQGILLDLVNFSCPAPTTAGFSINYLIEAAFQEVDAGSTVLPYYNAANPAVAFSGPNGTGTSNTTYRDNTVQLQLKPGAAATTGSQVTPTPDAGFNGLWVVTVAFGAVTITSANISQFVGAPFLSAPLLQQIQQAVSMGQISGIYAVRGFSGVNNASNPTTQMDFSANAVALRNPTTGLFNTVVNTGVITNNTSLAGPVANGRDTASAFTTNTFIHYYFIWNGTTLATLSSASLPTTGPTLPAGYTSWAYLGGAYWNGTVIAAVRAKGAWWCYSAPVTVVNAGSATANTAITLTAAIPSNSVEFELDIPNLSVVSTSGGAYSATCVIGIEAGVDLYNAGLQGWGGNSLTFGISGAAKRFANISSGFNYRITNLGSSTAQQTSIRCTAYSVPNGGE
jgi:hypothetical protein